MSHPINELIDPAASHDSVAQLIESGDVRECAGCGELSAYSWDDVSVKPDGERFQPGEIAHIGAASCFEWQCGHCGAYNAFKDAPILAECYTHVEPPDCSDLALYARCQRPSR
jgi:hypothetical protein